MHFDVTLMAAPRSLKVHLAGLDLPVRTTASDEEIQEIVDVIEGRLSDVQKASAAQPLHSHLALVAMSLAQELLTTQQEHHASLQDIESLSEELLEALGDDDA